MRSGETSSGMGSSEASVAQSDSCSWQEQSGRRHVVTEQHPLRGVDAPPPSGPQDLGVLREGRDRPLRLRRQLSLPNIFLEGSRCSGPYMAQHAPLCLPSDRTDPSGHQAHQRRPTQSPSGGPALEEPGLVLGAVQALPESPVADSPETGPPLSGKQNDLAPTAGALGSAPLVPRWEPTSLPGDVLNTISQARAPSTRRLYDQKWSVFVDWCSSRNIDPVESDVSFILSFLQERLEMGRTPSTLKVYVAAIAAFHAPIAGQSVGRNGLVIRFLRGARRLNPPRPLTVPTWDLSLVLRALKGTPFEPMGSADLRPLTLKTALLLALASVKRVGDLQVLSVSPACLEFGPGDSKVVLKPRHGYVPKVLSTPFRAQVISLSALPPSADEQELELLCPVRALRTYVERSQPFRQSDQLFVCFGGRTKGSPVSKQRLSRWIVDAINLCYSSLGADCPIGVRAHSTRGMTSSWAWSNGVSIQDICEAAGWSSPSTFVRFYHLDVPTLQARVLSV
ncbi:uncharacterized protein LOC125250806 [Megalobrama amblycephala]|uniref:uncharacterized protein LOC125250806 n=1 Tax=Megalobrama amblycephala TaxID=75352 RepID=UPI0020144DE9|nr:uncharacterized protein LOC125250806 [Megalobrama amblycephala]